MSRLLQGEDFIAFHDEVHGYEPFAWQVELLGQILTTGTWPQLIDLPTGSGKTSTVDIALFALAVEAQRGARRCRAPRRIVMVVDRRIVVDQVAQRAEALAQALVASPEESVCKLVRRSLESLSGDGPPLVSTVLRGGIVSDETWAKRPDVPAILSSTVDQLGSRLLFRGYGVSSKSASLHAGLLGNDTLILLDEVHLSQPFAQTLRALARYNSSSEAALPNRTQLVELSATPGESDQSRFPTVPLKADTAGAILGPRLRASKPVHLEAVSVPNSKDWRKGDHSFAKHTASHVLKELSREHVKLLGVVVNRVDTARSIAALLQDKGVSAVLLTGRMRPLDRDGLLDEHSSHWTDRTERGDLEAQVVVATQCIEAGADFDFDGIVTECASIDALRQRFGRVDRRGVLSAAGTPARGVILLRGDQADPTDPIYGAALAATWAWLCKKPLPDFGIELLGDAPTSCIASKPSAPLLTRLHLESFAQTGPIPATDHIAARWLHGDQETSPSVSILWRDELRDLLDDRESLTSDEIGEATERLALCPPIASESVEVPLFAAQRWLLRKPPHPVTDIESVSELIEDDRASLSKAAASPTPFLLWRNGSATTIAPDSIQPGSVIVVSTSAGGLGKHLNWDPEATHPVSDLAAIAARSSRKQILLRLSAPPTPAETEQTAEALNIAGLLEFAKQLRRTQCEISRQSLAQRVIKECETANFDQALAEAVESLRSNIKSLKVVESIRVGLDGEEELAFLGLSAVSASSGNSSAQINLGATDTGEGDDDSSFIGQPAYLDEHLLAVGELAQRFAGNLGFSEQLAGDLRLAGELHDLGKLDPRFQAWLVDGHPGIVDPGRPLAKSRTTTQEWTRRTAARQRSGYPNGARHELLSLALMSSAQSILNECADRELVSHLVASHHGHCRPFAPTAIDHHPLAIGATHNGTYLSASTETGAAKLNSGVADRYFSLTEKYGPYRLAWLEAVFRLADHRRSELEATR